MQKFFLNIFLCLFSLNILSMSTFSNVDMPKSRAKINQKPLTNIDIENSFKEILSGNSDILYTSVPRGAIISFPIYYFFDKEEDFLNESGKFLLDNLSELIRNINLYCVIEASSLDYGENAQKNLELSIIRADTISNYLIKKRGVSSNMIRAIGFGRIKPFSDNVSYKQHLDRRIDIVILNY